MDTRRFRRNSPAEALAAFRWLGWVMLMMFVLVQTAHAAGAGIKTQVDLTGSQTRELSRASAGFDDDADRRAGQGAEPVSSDKMPLAISRCCMTAGSTSIA
jgi:hypothetical protein